MTTSQQHQRLYLIANLAIFTIGLGFAVRASVAEKLRSEIFALVDPQSSGAMIGNALGITFSGFALTLLFGSALVDRIGSRTMLMLSALGYVFGSLLVLAATTVASPSSAYQLVTIGFLLTGLGWGAVESATNPMVAGLDPDNKVSRLNRLHAWWPAGIVVGGLLGFIFDLSHIPWQMNFLILILPAAGILLLLRGVQMPVTERVANGVSYADMFRELYRKPQFILFWCCMWLTASTELAPGQWVDVTLSNVVGMNAILILVYVSALMFVMRHFAGPLVKRFSSIGLMVFSSAFATAGLYGLSQADGPISAFVYATVWGVGVCFMWPTMLGIVAERFPRGGALFLGLLGFGGGLAIQFLLPKLGRIFDQAKQLALSNAGSGLSETEALAKATHYAATVSFESIIYIPLTLIPLFSAIWCYDRLRAVRHQPANT